MTQLHIVLYEPEIPPNTGNIIRLCANTGAILHLIHPLGFSLDEKKVRRAGLDYHDASKVIEYDNYQAFCDRSPAKRIIACSTKATTTYSDVTFQTDDALLFGPETRGLPETLLNTFPDSQKVRIPMQKNSRSLNLSNAVSIILYEAWRQLGFS